jgi:hypothetical protein
MTLMVAPDSVNATAPAGGAARLPEDRHHLQRGQHRPLHPRDRQRCQLRDGRLQSVRPQLRFPDVVPCGHRLAPEAWRPWWPDTPIAVVDELGSATPSGLPEPSTEGTSSRLSGIAGRPNRAGSAAVRMPDRMAKTRAGGGSPPCSTTPMERFRRPGGEAVSWPACRSERKKRGVHLPSQQRRPP